MSIHKRIKVNTIKAVGDRVLVTDMYFGEQKTKSGLILTSDDGKTRGVYPRWGKVYAKGPHNDDPYEKDQWVYVEHGRWTRGVKIEDADGEKTVRMVERDAILAYADEKPNDVVIGKEFDDTSSFDVDPSVFANNGEY